MEPKIDRAQSTYKTWEEPEKLRKNKSDNGWFSRFPTKNNFETKVPSKEEFLTNLKYWENISNMRLDGMTMAKKVERAGNAIREGITMTEELMMKLRSLKGETEKGEKESRSVEEGLIRREEMLKSEDKVSIRTEEGWKSKEKVSIRTKERLKSEEKLSIRTEEGLKSEEKLSIRTEEGLKSEEKVSIKIDKNRWLVEENIMNSEEYAEVEEPQSKSERLYKATKRKVNEYDGEGVHVIVCKLEMGEETETMPKKNDIKDTRKNLTKLDKIETKTHKITADERTTNSERSLESKINLASQQHSREDPVELLSCQKDAGDSQTVTRDRKTVGKDSKIIAKERTSEKLAESQIHTEESKDSQKLSKIVFNSIEDNYKEIEGDDEKEKSLQNNKNTSEENNRPNKENESQNNKEPSQLSIDEEPANIQLDRELSSLSGSLYRDLHDEILKKKQQEHQEVTESILKAMEPIEILICGKKAFKYRSAQECLETLIDQLTRNLIRDACVTTKMRMQIESLTEEIEKIAIENEHLKNTQKYVEV